MSVDWIKEGIAQALVAANRQSDAMRRLAMHYPEAQHILDSPRKSDVVVILERIYHRLGLSDRDPGVDDRSNDRSSPDDRDPK
jgi:hypothetical protein